MDIFIIYYYIFWQIFLLDRQLVPGMFVKKGTDESIGIVKAVDVSLAASLESEMPGGQVMNDIEARLLEWDWVSTKNNNFVVLELSKSNCLYCVYSKQSPFLEVTS